MIHWLSSKVDPRSWRNQIIISRTIFFHIDEINYTRSHILPFRTLAINICRNLYIWDRGAMDNVGGWQVWEKIGNSLQISYTDLGMLVMEWEWVPTTPVTILRFESPQVKRHLISSTTNLVHEFSCELPNGLKLFFFTLFHIYFFGIVWANKYLAITRTSLLQTWTFGRLAFSVTSKHFSNHKKI